MRSPRPGLLVIVLPVLLLAAGAAQSQGSGSGKIVCWKDKSGRVVGCGDKVPPEYLDSGTKELNKRGVTVRQSDAALTPEQRQAQQAELERKQAEEQKKTEQRRHDKALLDTFSDEKEIELKRGRDVQLMESNIESLQTNLKNANDRQADSRARIAQYTKRKEAVPAPVQDEFDRSESDKAKIQKQIDQKRKEIKELHQRYDELKARFRELKGGTAASAPAPSATASPAAKVPPAPATSAQPPTSASPAKK